MVRACVTIIGALLLASCYDFVDPDFPEADAPALLQASATMDPSGTVIISALLVPGLQEGGFPRNVLRDTLDIYGLKLAPKDVKKNGSRVYAYSGKVPSSGSTQQEFRLQAPTVEAVSGPPPSVDWFGIQFTDPDTITWTRGIDLVLHLRANPGVSTPSPPLIQWFLELRGSTPTFRVSSDGVPPETLRIPSAWVPAPLNGVVRVDLSFFQSGQQLSPAADYVGNISFNLQLRRIVLVKEP